MGGTTRLVSLSKYTVEIYLVVQDRKEDVWMAIDLF